MSRSAPLRAPGPVGLLLTGGGARAAYQVGVLQAIAAIARDCGQAQSNPFQVITGTSAGAINAAALACQADRFQTAISEVADLWQHIHAEQVYRADSVSMLRTGAPWLTMMSFGWLLTRWRRIKPRSLLDNSPLQALLHRLVRFERLPMLMAQGHLRALAVTASSYSSGHHVTFYECEDDLPPWTRSQRIAVRAMLNTQHLLASAAIPFVFPAISLPIAEETEWFGDGSMRQAAPISPAVHLGAERVLIIGAGRMHEPPGRRMQGNGYPSVAQIAGHALSNIFLDALAVDIERLQRINATLSLLPPDALAHTPLRPIEALVISPSQRLDDLAAQHIDSLPLAVRTLLGAVGVTGRGASAHGGALASYLLFEADYTRALMALGVADTELRRNDVIRFFRWTAPSTDLGPPNGGGVAAERPPRPAAATSTTS